MRIRYNKINDNQTKTTIKTGYGRPSGLTFGAGVVEFVGLVDGAVVVSMVVVLVGPLDGSDGVGRVGELVQGLSRGIDSSCELPL